MTRDMREVFVTQVGELSSDKRHEREVFVTQVGKLSSDKRHDRGVYHSGGEVI